MSELFSRGEIKNGDSFHIVARVKDSVTGTQLSEKIPGLSAWSSGTDSPGKHYFFLCQNQYRLGSNSQQRLYFSSDPEDFQPDYNHNSLNEGCVFIKSNTNLGNYNLKYSTTLDKNNNKVPPYFKTISVNLNQQSMVNLSSYSLGINIKNNNFNLDNRLFLSIPYDINFTSNQTLQLSDPVYTNWVFRKVTSNNNNPDNINFYSTNNIDLSSKLSRGDVEKKIVNLTSSQYTFDGSTFTIKYNLLSTSDKEKLKRFSQNTGIIKITEGTNKEIIIYKTIIISGSNEYKFLISKRGAAGTTHGGNYTGSITIQTDIRNSDGNFTIVDNEDLNEVLDFFLIPSQSIAYFYQGRKLDNMINELVKPDNIKIYSRSTGNDDTLYYSRFFYNFLSYSLLDDLTTHWTRDGLTGFPNLATFQYHNNKKSTLFTWKDGSDSAAGFMFDYCKSNQNCGSCFGITKFNSSFCYANSSTREKILNGEPDPLNNVPNNYSSSANTYRDAATWSMLSVHLILTILLVIILIKSYPKSIVSDDQGSNNITDVKNNVDSNN